MVDAASRAKRVLVTADGRVFTVGDSSTEVSIQSISKVFTLARVLQDSGETAILTRMGKPRCFSSKAFSTPWLSGAC